MQILKPVDKKLESPSEKEMKSGTNFLIKKNKKYYESKLLSITDPNHPYSMGTYPNFYGIKIIPTDKKVDLSNLVLLENRDFYIDPYRLPLKTAPSSVLYCMLKYGEKIEADYILTSKDPRQINKIRKCKCDAVFFKKIKNKEK